MTTDRAREIASGLSEEAREAWIWTILAVGGTDATRHAFLDGYNGLPCNKPVTAEKRRYHERGLAVRSILSGEA